MYYTSEDLNLNLVKVMQYVFLQAEVEMIWAMKAQHQAETYFKVVGLKHHGYCIIVLKLAMCVTNLCNYWGCTAFCVTVKDYCLFMYSTNRFRLAVCLFSNRSQMMPRS